MRQTLACVTILAAALFAVPAAPAASVAGGGADRADRVDVSARGGIEEIRTRVVALTNARRAEHGCRPLAAVRSLVSAAQTHSRKMADRNTLSHQLPGEAPLGSRVRRAGYDWTLVGENVASGYPTPEAVVRGWMASTGHRRNILTCRFKHIGVGYALSDGGTPYWTQVFGRR